VGFNIDPSLNGYTPERMKVFYPQLSDSLASIPGVQSVGLASMRILEDNEWGTAACPSRASLLPNPVRMPEPYMNSISPNYFATLGVPIVAGRDFRSNDNHQVKHGPEVWNWTPTAVMINEKFAKKFFPDAIPSAFNIGLRHRSWHPHRHGSHRRVKDFKVHQSPRRKSPSRLSFPILAPATSANDRLPPHHCRSQSIDDCRAFHKSATWIPISHLRHAYHRSSDQQLPFHRAHDRQPLRRLRLPRHSTRRHRSLRCHAYTVAQRTREVGIRIALGAARGNVIWLVMREVLLLVAIGVVAGVVFSLMLTRVVQSQLFGLTPHDPLTLGLATAVLAFVACAAGYIPALRA